MTKNLYKYYIILSALFYSFSINGQSIQQQADSIQLLIENAAEDTVKAKHYVTLGSLYVYSEPNKAVGLLHKALAFAKKINSNSSQANSSSFLFNTHDVLGSHSDSLMTYIKALEQLNKEMRSVKYEVKVHWNMAIYYRNFGQNDKIIEEYLKALKLVRDNNLPKRDEARLLGNIGATFDSNGDYLEALKYYDQSAPLFGDDKIGEAITYLNMATIYGRQLNAIDTALTLLDKTYKIVKEYENYSLIAAVLIEQGFCNDVQKKYEYAEQFYNQALQIATKYNLGENFVTIYSSYASHYLARKQYQVAIQYSDKAIALCEEKKDNRFLETLYEVQDEAYSEIGDYKNAYEIKSKLMVHLDSLNNTELQGKIKELQTEYEVEQKITENKLLKLDLQSRQYLSIALIIALIFAIALGVLAYKSSQQRKRHNDILEQKVTERTKELKQANYELRTFNYIASHDIKEPIRNIGSYVGLIKRKLPSDLKEGLSEYFDTIKSSTTQLYTLIEDFAYYTTMSKDETIKTTDVDLNILTNNVVNQIEASIKKYDGQVLIAKLPTIQTGSSLLFTTLKNLIENGLKYNKSEKPTVEISYKKTETHHKIIVSDNGIGINEKYRQQVFEMFKRLHNRGQYEGSGIGLAIVKLSVDKLGGTVDLESSEETGSQFIINLPT